MVSKTMIPKLSSIKWKNGIHAENVTCLNSRARKSIPAADVLMGALADNVLKDVVIIGYDHDGELHIYGSMPEKEKAHFLFSKGAQCMIDIE